MSRRVYVETYGCQMNLSDTELLHGHLAAHGFARAEQIDDADVVLLNTCAIRSRAEDRIAGRLTQLLPVVQKKPGVLLGIVGCMAQHHRERLLERLPFLDLVLGPDEYRRLPAMLEGVAVRDPQVEVRLGRDETYADVEPARASGVRAWVTAMRGCDKFCTFCVVPYVRGRERSLPIGVLVSQVERAAADGFREVVFLGQTVNAYRDGSHDFADLLRAAARVEGIERIRFTSPHPADMSDRLLEVFATEAVVCPQLHLPLQSASNAVLARMKRGYTIEVYDDLVSRLRRARPGIELSTDLIVGFPGETETDFDETLGYVSAVGYDHAFSFAYSPRERARSFEWPETISREEKGNRLATLIDLQERITAERSRAWIGRTVEVLAEGPAKRQTGWLSGKTPEFRTVVFPAAGSRPGDFVDVAIEDSTAHTLVGSPAKLREARVA